MSFGENLKQKRRVPTGQEKLEKLREFEWSGKVRGKYFL